jgi:F-type H+-transporting ATPase subunit gamma
LSLLKLRSRYRTIKSLNSIFSALQVVTIVRTKKVRDVYSTMDRYVDPMRRVLDGRVERKKLDRKVLVVVTSNRGLCGGFNRNIIAKALDFVKQNPDAELVPLGKTGAKYFKNAVFSDLEAVEKPNFNKTAAALRRILALDAQIYIAYNTYRSALVQTPKLYRLYPVPEELDNEKAPRDYILEPEPASLLPELFIHYLEARFFQMVMDSQMGELSARFIVLKEAVDSSKDICDDLAVAINKARQANITRELLEVVSAAEALRRDYE